MDTCFAWKHKSQAEVLLWKCKLSPIPMNRKVGHDDQEQGGEVDDGAVEESPGIFSGVPGDELEAGNQHVDTQEKCAGEVEPSGHVDEGGQEADGQ